jgi:type VI secretion system secreted protein VgrG
MSAVGGAASVVAGVVGIGAGQSDSLVYDANGQAGYTDSERVFSFSLGDPLVPKQIQLRHWNIKDATSYTAKTKVAPVSAGVSLNAIASISLTQPSNFGLNAAFNVAVDSPSIAPSEASVFEYARDLSLQNASVSEELQVASRALAQARADGLPGQGTTDCRRLAPGYRFTLQKHPVAALNSEYLVTEILCEGSSPDHNPDPKVRDYQCSFRCVPSRVNPLPRKPAPRTHSPEPAVVIGPNWGEIYCDDMQRILVRFRWTPGDAYSEDGEGVCRVQLLDPWGGHGYGIQAIPRVGTEVMVAFFDGGEPIAIGQLRSRVNRPAFDSPQEVTKVGIKSRVIPNGRESEISIDDHPDKNKILIRSSGELLTEVQSNTTATHSANYSVEITGDRREVTAGGATLIYDKDVTTDILGNLQDQVAKDRVMVTDGSVTDWIGGDLSKSVGGCVESMIQGDHEAVFEANSLERHYGHHTVVVAAQGADGRASASFHVEGPARAYARREIEVTSPEGFTFSSGDSHITVRKDSVTIASPTIVLVGKTVQVTASDTAAVAAKTATVAGSDSVTVSGANTATLAGQSATVVLDSNATIEGSKVKLGGGGSGPSSQKQQSKPKRISTLKLSDTDGNPLANQRVILRKGGDGGEERVVVLDTNGAIDVEGDDPFDVFFPDTPKAKS